MTVSKLDGEAVMAPKNNGISSVDNEYRDISRNDYERDKTENKTRHNGEDRGGRRERVRG